MKWSRKNFFFHISDEVLRGVPIQVTVLKHEVKHKEFIRNKSIVFTLNGQVQGFEGQSFISQDLGFSLLKEHALIQVDCTHIPTRIRQDLFMSNRTQLKQGPEREMLRTTVISSLKNSANLKRINDERKKTCLKILRRVWISSKHCSPSYPMTRISCAY